MDAVEPGGTGMRDVLVVADETVGGEDLLEAVTGRLAAGPCAFGLLVPAIPPRDVARAVAASDGQLTVSENDPTELTHRRLGTARHWLSRNGAIVHGPVGDSDRLRAIPDVLKHRHFEEIIIATPPGRVPHWFHRDLAKKVRNKANLAVEEVAAKLANRVDV
jgi:hypothetical protein